jgi:hypothetical protein
MLQLDAIHSAVNETQRLQMKLQENVENALRKEAENVVLNVTSSVDNRIGVFEAKMIEGQKLIQDQVCRALLECYLFKNR